jgi:hypothetical protein
MISKSFHFQKCFLKMKGRLKEKKREHLIKAQQKQKYNRKKAFNRSFYEKQNNKNRKRERE